MVTKMRLSITGPQKAKGMKETLITTLTATVLNPNANHTLIPGMVVTLPKPCLQVSNLEPSLLPQSYLNLQSSTLNPKAPYSDPT